MQLPEGLRLSAQGDRRPAAQPHDPQPDAGADAGLHHLRDRLRAQGLARGARDPPGATRSGWTCRTAGSYPVFNVRKGSGQQGPLHVSRRRQNPYGGGPKKNQWVVDRPGVLVATAGHLHPGGLYTDLKCAAARADRAAVPLPGQVLRAGGRGVVGRRDDRHAARLAGEGAEGRRAVGQRDLRPSAAPGGSRWGSWSSTWPTAGRAKNPFKTKVNRPGRVTHGHLPENDNHGGGPTRCPTRARSPTAPTNPGFVDLANFSYQLGDLSLGDPARQPAGDPRRASR